MPPITTQHILFVGNPVDGIVPWGPFESWDDAAHWAEHNTIDLWCISALRNPNEA